MSVNGYSWKQYFALSLTAPILATGSQPNFDKLAHDPVDTVRNMLSSWWQIHTVEELRETLRWLDEQGGHTRSFLMLKHYLERKTYYERQAYIASLREHNRDQYIRANLIERYRLNLGRHTILAFDISRITLLLRSGYVLGWLTEDETWAGLLQQADRVIDQRMWLSHFDYLYSFIVGRAFGMCQEIEGIMRSVREAHFLLTDLKSPWLSYAPWPRFDKGSDQPPTRQTH